MTGRPDFRRRDAARTRSVRPLLAGLFVATLLAVVLQALRASPTLSGQLVEVTGAVPEPGTYLIEPATLGRAVQAAGGDPAGLPRASTPVPAGHRVDVGPDGAQILAPSDPLLVGLPVNVNEAEVHELMAIPGIGARTAGAVVAHREEHGPFRNLDALTAVPGLGPASLEEVRPFLVVPNARPDLPLAPVDVNAADAAELDTLPGIGPVTAARIVVERAEGGPFQSLDDLQRVHGIGPALVEGLGERAVAGGAP